MATSIERTPVEERLAELRRLPHWNSLSNGGRRRLILQALGAEEAKRLRPRPVLLDGMAWGPTSPAVPGQPVNVRVNRPSEDTGTSGTTQSEPSVAVALPNIVVSFNDSEPTSGWAGYSNSVDVGITFTDETGVAPAAQERGDQVLAVSRTGVFHMSALGHDASAHNNVGVATSPDGGATFGAPVDASTTANTAGSADKQWLACDTTGGTYDGNLYLGWTNFESTGARILFARSIDGNGSWQAPQYLSATGTNPHGATPAVAPDGTVYVVWFDRSSGDISLRSSSNGGQAFTNPVTGGGVVTTIALIPTTLNGGFRANSFPSIAVGPDGTVYIAYAARNGTDNADVYLIRSGNSGATWSAPVRVNDDATTTDQWMPSVAVTSNNVVGVMFYDRRNDAANLNIDVYLAMSLDGGATFLASQRITSQSFPPVVGVDPDTGSTYMGDYNQMVAVGTRFYMAWGDNRDMVGTRNDADVFFAQVGTEDCYVRDSPADDGTVPSAAGQAWQSPDIQPAMNPSVFGTPNPITVTVHNFGPKDASGVEVQLFWADPATYIPRSAWHSDRFTVSGATTNTQTIPTVPAGGAANTPLAFVWDPPDPTLATQNGHYCLLAQIQTAGDPLSYPGAGGWQTIERDNNLAVRNVHVDPMGTGPSTLHFLVGAELERTLETHLSIDTRRVPAHFAHTLVLSAEIARDASFHHLSHHPEQIKLLPPEKRRQVEADRQELTVSRRDNALAVILPHNRVAHIGGLRIPPGQGSPAELTIERGDRKHPIQDGELRVTQQIGGHTVGGLLYLLRGTPQANASGKTEDD